MFDPFVLLAPLLVLLVVSLLRFVGCDLVFKLGKFLTIAHVQKAENAVVNDSAQVTTAAFQLAVTAGNLVVVWIFYRSASAAVLTMTDSAGNTYKRAAGPTQGIGVVLNAFKQELWWAQSVKAGTNVVVTATFDIAFNDEKAISAHEYVNAVSIDQNQVLSDAGNEADPKLGEIDMSADSLLFAACLFQSVGNEGGDFIPRSDLRDNVAEDKRFPQAEANVTALFSTGGVAQEFVAQAIKLFPKREDTFP